MFGDITTGRMWYANRADVLAADDGEAKTVAPIYEIDTTLRRMVEETYRERGGKTPALPGMGAVAGPGRVDVRFAEDNEGELYVLTKPDGVIRKVVACPGDDCTGAGNAGRDRADAESRSERQQPAGRQHQESRCADVRVGCRREAGLRRQLRRLSRPLAQGAVKAGITISILEEQKARQPPDLTDGQWDHGSTDGEIFTVIKRGVPPTMMAGYDGRIPDADIWSIVNYLRTLRPGK